MDTVLTCPKCKGRMHSYERSGIVVDQCGECRGIFFDRGELERLLDLESGSVAPAPNPQFQAPVPDREWRGQAPQSRAWAGRADWDDDSDSDGHRRGPGGYPAGHGGHRPYRKKKSLLREFLDFG